MSDLTSDDRFTDEEMRDLLTEILVSIRGGEVTEDIQRKVQAAIARRPEVEASPDSEWEDEDVVRPDSGRVTALAEHLCLHVISVPLSDVEALDVARVVVESEWLADLMVQAKAEALNAAADQRMLAGQDDSVGRWLRAQATAAKYGAVHEQGV